MQLGQRLNRKVPRQEQKSAETLASLVGVGRMQGSAVVLGMGETAAVVWVVPGVAHM